MWRLSAVQSKEIDRCIKECLENQLNYKEIANELNYDNLLTQRGLSWTGENVSYYARTKLGIENKRDRSSGLIYQKNEIKGSIQTDLSNDAIKGLNSIEGIDYKNYGPGGDNMKKEISQALIEGYLESDQEYPVNFEDAWQWVGYARKDNAKKMLVNNFEENLDFSSFRQTAERETGATIKEEIWLTTDCFKEFCMLARTEKGKEARKYFVQVEKEITEEDLELLERHINSIKLQLIDVKNQFSKSLFKIRGTIIILTIVLAIISIIGYII
jgi:phage anti-repressor protein